MKTSRKGSEEKGLSSSFGPNRALPLMSEPSPSRCSHMPPFVYRTQNEVRKLPGRARGNSGTGSCVESRRRAVAARCSCLPML